jgi:hypothetical protein
MPTTLPDAEAAVGETAVAASAAELMAAVRKKSLLVLNSISSNHSQRVRRYSYEKPAKHGRLISN